jgi:hypothetical protein
MHVHEIVDGLQSSELAGHDATNPPTHVGTSAATRGTHHRSRLRIAQFSTFAPSFLSASLFPAFSRLHAPEHVSFAMLIPPLARAAHRPGFRASGWSLSARLSPYYATRVFTSSPLHRKDVHGQRPLPGSTPALQDTKAAKPASDPAPVKVAKTDPLLQEQPLSTKEQRKADWAIMKEMTQYLWPKDNLGTRFRVGLSVGLLVGAKLLNVQVPFYFKNIVDSMNIDFLAVGGTAWTVAGSMIMACKLHQSMQFHPTLAETACTRRPHSHGRNPIPRTPECSIRQRRPESYTQGGVQCVRALAQAGLELPSYQANRRLDEGN